MERTYAAFRKQWARPALELSVTSPQVEFREYPNESNPRDGRYHIMVGDLVRIRKYVAHRFPGASGPPGGVGSWTEGWLLLGMASICLRRGESALRDTTSQANGNEFGSVLEACACSGTRAPLPPSDLPLQPVLSLTQHGSTRYQRPRFSTDYHLVCGYWYLQTAPRALAPPPPSPSQELQKNQPGPAACC